METALERRQRLLARAARERERLAAELERYRPLAGVADDLVRVGRGIAAHPEWVVGAVVAVAVIRPRWLLRVAGRAWVAWRAVRTVKSFLRRVS